MEGAAPAATLDPPLQRRVAVLDPAVDEEPRALAWQDSEAVADLGDGRLVVAVPVLDFLVLFEVFEGLVYLRVEAADGTLLHSTTGNETSRDALYVSATRKSWLLAPRLVTPVYDDAGLVRRRPEAAYGEAVFGDPRWSSMLDPVELAGNAPVAMVYPGANRVEVADVAEETFAGRPVLAATVSPNASYEPAAAGRPLVGEGRTRVLLDVGTAVCVSTTALDGPARGAGHELHILGVDEYLTDDYFRAAPPELSDVSRHVPWIVG